MQHHINFDIKTFSIISSVSQGYSTDFRKFVPQHKNLHYETIFSCIYLPVALCFR